MLVTEEMVATMRPGSVIVDVVIDQGGCIETSRATTHSNPTYREYDVIHYCVPNMPSNAAQDGYVCADQCVGPLPVTDWRCWQYERCACGGM